MIAILLALLAVVNVSNSSVSYACDGSTAVYTVNYPYLAYTDLVVTSTTGAGVVTTLVYTTDYTVNLASTSSTATLTLNSPSTKCPSGNTLKIVRTTARTQPTSFKAQTSYSQTLHELAYDRTEMQVQELASCTTPTAGPSSSGCLSSTDWNTFNNKGSNGVSLSSQNTWTAPQTVIPGGGFPTGTGITGTGGATSGYGGKFQVQANVNTAINLQPQSEPSAHADGDFWFNADVLQVKVRINSQTYVIAPLKAGTIALTTGTPSTASVSLGIAGLICTCTAVTAAADNATLKCSVSGSTLTITGPNTNTNTFAYTCMVTQ